MKKLSVILIGVVVILSGFVFYLKKQLDDMTRDRDRIENNYNQEVTKLNKSLSYNRAELKSYIDRNKELDSLLKAERIKPPQIKYITLIEYDYITDTVEADVLPPIKEFVYPIEYNDGCFLVEGQMDVKEINLIFDKLEFNNKQTHIGYLKKRDTGRRILWIFPIRRKYLELHVHNTCGESVVTNININE